MSKLKLNNFQTRVNLPEVEHDVLDYWDKTDAFNESVTSRPADNPYIFYDGPPFATGTPHYGHILVSTIKDVFPRYKTMRGFRVERVWGWDCHGLPIENIVEKQLDLKNGKRGIEELGIDKFNDACRAAIWKFDKEWERVIRRIGRWVDFKNSYKTMDTSYMESVWWAFKELYEKDLVYQGRKVMLYCSRCATPLSNFEIAMDNSYKDDEDNSITVKFPVKGKKNEYLLAWTTTPWTLIGNVGLAINPEAEYIKAEVKGEIYYLAKDRQEILEGSVKVLDIFKGEKLVNTEYEPLYPYLDIGKKKAFYVASAEFVSLDEGTGIVHTAAMYGEDDFTLASELDLPLVPMLDDQGKFLDFVEPLAGQYYKKSEKWVIDDLKERDLMYKAERLVHSVAHCYRCDTQLFYNALPAWFIDIQRLKPELLKHNEAINWYPDHLKHGRFGKGLETAPDWNISRSRYWGTPMPIWLSEDGKKLRVIGSRDELKKWAVDPKSVGDLEDIHREFVDHIEVWVDDKKTIKGHRIPEVFDCWVESGSMPYASVAYPFQNKKKFEAAYPAQFITEYIAQTRAWFYTLHVMSVAIFGTHSFENALTTGNIQAEDGQKMSKSKKNYPDPEPLFEKYGVDAMRFYLMSSSVMRADNTNFSEQGVKETYQKLINILWNTFTFYKLYAGDIEPNSELPDKFDNVLDRWIVSRTHTLIKQVGESLDDYNTIVACRLIQDFATDLSTWYLRRSRDRIRDGGECVAVFGWVLDQLIHVLAPITPFITEYIYQNLHDAKSSIHLDAWPEYDESRIDTNLEAEMQVARKIVENLHSLRQKSSLKIRQPLSAWSLNEKASQWMANKLELQEVIAEETNIKNFELQAKDLEQPIETDIELSGSDILSTITVYLDTAVTNDLKAEGQARELVRQIQGARKKADVSLDQQIDLILPEWPVDFEDFIKDKTLVRTLTKGDQLQINPVDPSSES